MNTEQQKKRKLILTNQSSVLTKASGSDGQEMTEKDEEAESSGAGHIWTCEFCGHSNQVELEEEEVRLEWISLTLSVTF